MDAVTPLPPARGAVHEFSPVLSLVVEDDPNQQELMLTTRRSRRGF